ncbi:MAG TPA: hypothetical protein VK874_03965 [Gaiellaceae bacterium]|nr:hypothetical protein [Gaiellaceae bacterium]
MTIAFSAVCTSTPAPEASRGIETTGTPLSVSTMPGSSGSNSSAAASVPALRAARPKRSAIHPGADGRSTSSAFELERSRRETVASRRRTFSASRRGRRVPGSCRGRDRAAAAIKANAFTRTVSPNDYATLTITVTPRARCTITVIYDTVVSKARGLGPKTGGKITWRWKVGSATHPGTWPVRVNCGRSGKLNTRLRVLPS